jgi:hypothetical protein
MTPAVGHFDLTVSAMVLVGACRFDLAAQICGIDGDRDLAACRRGLDLSIGISFDGRADLFPPPRLERGALSRRPEKWQPFEDTRDFDGHGWRALGDDNAIGPCGVTATASGHIHF